MAEKVFSVDAAIGYIKRFTNALIFGKNDVSLSSVPDSVLFFCKVPVNSSGLFLVEIKDSDNNRVGSLVFGLTTGKTSYLGSCATALGASSEVISNGKIFVSKNYEDDKDLSNVYLGVSLPNEGQLKITYQAIMSNRGVVQSIQSVRSYPRDAVSFELSKGYLLNRPLFEDVDALNAFRKWDSTFAYEAYNPVFYGAHLYYANPNLLPSVGEDPVHYPSKWLELATAEIPDTDISKGAYTPQLFHNKSLVITNDSAIGLRKAHRDVGYEYPSANSKVYHFDGDLLDQDQANPLEISVPEIPEIEPVFIESGFTGAGVSSDPAIAFKPLKEKPAFYYGSFSFQKTLDIDSAHNVFALYFKYPDVEKLNNCTIARIRLSTGETISIVAFTTEVAYNEDAKMSYWDLEDDPVYNIPESTKDALVVNSSYNGLFSKTEIFTGFPLISDSWAHICFKVERDALVVFYRGQTATVARLSTGFGQVVFDVNPSQTPFAIDELLFDSTASVTYSRYLEIATESLPWAEHEKSENWFVLHVQDLTKVDTNLFDTQIFKDKVREIISENR